MDLSLFDQINKKVLEVTGKVTGDSAKEVTEHFKNVEAGKPAQPAPHEKVRNIEAGHSGILGAIEEVVVGGKLPKESRIGEVLTRLGGVLVAEEALGEGQWLDFPGSFIIAPFLAQIVAALLAGNYRELEQAGNFAFRNRLLGAQAAIELWRRGKLTSDKLRLELSKEGISDENRELLIQATEVILTLDRLVDLYHRGAFKSKDELYDRAHRVGAEKETVDLALKEFKKLLGIGDAITMWRRGITVEGAADAFDDLRTQGFTDERIEALKNTSYVLPNIFQIQDFKVRGVDDPAIVEKFKLDAFIDEDYFTQAGKLGYTRQTAQRMYRYYWNLPSFFVMRNLYQSGRITEQDFRDLLRMARFTPYWVDRMADTLKPRLSQGDIKDMYKFQLITADQIVTKLKEIGTADALAKDLKTLWVADVKLSNPQNSTDAQLKAAKIRDDTIGMIKTAYKDRVVTRPKALELLKHIHYSNDTAELELQIADYELQQESIKLQFQSLKESVLAGVLTIGEATTKLQSHGVTPSQLDLYISEIQRAMTHKPKTPTLAEFHAWLKKGIITLAQYDKALALLGYAEKWRPYYFEEAGYALDDLEAAGLNYATALSN